MGGEDRGGLPDLDPDLLESRGGLPDLDPDLLKSRGGLPNLDPDLLKSRGGLPDSDPDLLESLDGHPELIKFLRQVGKNRDFLLKIGKSRDVTRLSSTFLDFPQCFWPKKDGKSQGKSRFSPILSRKFKDSDLDPIPICWKDGIGHFSSPSPRLQNAIPWFVFFSYDRVSCKLKLFWVSQFISLFWKS